MKADTTIPIQTLPPEIKVGSELGSYRLVAVLGQGAMGRVFKGRHVKLGREVAIKVLNPEYVARADVVKRFFREARVVNQINHEHIVEVTDFVEQPGCAFLVMELLEGLSLRDLMKGKSGKKRPKKRWPSIQQSAEVMAQVCDALEAAHSNSVVHRDLKPDNIFIVKRNGGDYAKVLDFGVAKLQEPLQGDSATKSTMAGLVIGTPLYMPPEQASGQKIDRHADVWSAGVVLYELLSGDVPFRAPSFVDLATKLRVDPPKPLPLKTPRGEIIPTELAAAVMKCLEKKPADRWRSMALLADVLRSVAGSVKRRRTPGLLLRLAAVLLIFAAATLGVRYDLHRQLAGAAKARLSRLWQGASRTVTKAIPDGGPLGTDNKPPPADPEPKEPAPPPIEEPGPGTPKEEPGPPPQVAMVEIQLYSKPSRVTVVRLDTGEELGETPLRVKLPRDKEYLALQFKRPGYRSVTASIGLEKNGKARVTLRRVKSPQKAPVKKSYKKRPRSRHHR